jgi:hypothetical protein
LNEDLNARRENSGNEKLSDKKYFKIVLAAGIIALTVFLMIFFKKNPDGIRKIVAEQGENLVSFYTNNLQPALIGSKLTVSDVFNFAVNDNLPIDKDNNTCLYVGSAANGRELMELRPAMQNKEEFDYNRFKREAKLSAKQERELDSILNSYKPRIEKLILSNEDNTIAVNANMWNLNKYILIDVVRFLKKEDKEAFLNSIMPHSISDSALDASFAQMKDVDPDEYVFIAPDTVFPMKYKYTYNYEAPAVRDNEERVRNERERSRTLETAVARIRENSDRLNKQLNHKFMTRINVSDKTSEALKIEFDSNLIPPEVPEMPEDFNFKINAVKDKLQEMSIKFGRNAIEFNENRFKMNLYDDEGDSSILINIDLSGIPGLSEEMMEMADSISAMSMQMNFNINDSISNKINKSKDRTKEKAKSKSRSH